MKMYAPIHSTIESAATAGLKEGGRDVLAAARQRVPERDGKLRRSGRVVVDDLDVTVKFTAPHAWLQHERLDYQHPNGGEAKYLENAALETPVAEKVADAVRRALG